MKYLGFDLKDLLEKEEYIRKLPAKKRRFVEAFTTYLSIEKACKALGLTYRRGYNLMQKEEIQKAIQYMQEIIAFRNSITQDYFIEKLKDIIEDKKSKTSDRINALNLLARITGHIKERNIDNSQIVVLKRETPTEEKEAVITIKKD